MRTHDASPDSAARRSAASFLAIWFVVIFVFFSIPRSKLGSYILPAMPPLATVAGYGLAQLSASRRLATPSSDRDHYDREHGTRRRSLRVLRIRTGPDKSCAPPRRTAARLRPGSRPNRDVLAGARPARIPTRLPLSRSRCSRRCRSRLARAATRPPSPPIAASQPPLRPTSPATVRSPPTAITCSRCHSTRAQRETRVEYWGELSEVAPPRRASRRSSSAPRRACARRRLPAHAWF